MSSAADPAPAAPGTPRNIKLTIEYDGTAYSGWQRQANAPTIQQTLEEALAAMTGGAPVTLHGAGRTDSGVHARAQVANFRTTVRIPLLGFLRGLNASLPRDIAIIDAAEVPADWDARRAARGKHYAYRIWTREARSPLHDRTTWHVTRPLDLGAMSAAAAVLVGEHDFSAFRAADCERKNPVRTIRRLDVTRAGEHLVVIDAEATAFLKNMVRVIVGTLAEVGQGLRTVDSLAPTLASRDRSQAGRTAPPQGLMLEQVYYPDESSVRVID